MTPLPRQAVASAQQAALANRDHMHDPERAELKTGAGAVQFKPRGGVMYICWSWRWAGAGLIGTVISHTELHMVHCDGASVVLITLPGL